MKGILTLIISLLAITSFSQVEDSVRLRDTQDSTSVNQPSVPGRQSPPLDEQVGFTQDNTERIQTAEVPPALRKTLQDAEYAGWENGAVYRNITTNEYKVELLQHPDVKTYYFDKEGRRILE